MLITSIRGVSHGERPSGYLDEAGDGAREQQQSVGGGSVVSPGRCKGRHHRQHPRMPHRLPYLRADAARQRLTVCRCRTLLCCLHCQRDTRKERLPR
jgi:hypothetical protein